MLVFNDEIEIKAILKCRRSTFTYSETDAFCTLNFCLSSGDGEVEDCTDINDNIAARMMTCKCIIKSIAAQSDINNHKICLE
ncbi:MAG: hypothetical protein WCF23_13730 [Candidatus Nitrosopolaris sp.]